MQNIASKSSIYLFIENKGNQNILNEDFYKDPSEVWVNNIYYESCKKSCNMDSDINNVTLIFNENLNSCENMFKDTNIIEIDLSKFDASSVTSMKMMFYQCSNLKKINFGNINTRSVNDMSELFHYCYNLLYIDVSKFDTSSVTTMKQMFRHCDTIKYIDASNFITSNVVDMEDLFSECGNLDSVNVLSFDTSKVKYMNGMFSACGNIKYIDLRNFKGNSVVNMNHMFFCCNNLIFLNFQKIQISNINAGMDYMFYNINSNLKYCTSEVKLKNLLSGKTLDCEVYALKIITNSMWRQVLARNHVITIRNMGIYAIIIALKILIQL